MLGRFLRRLKTLLGCRKPGMIGTPPSARQVPPIPARTRVDFSRRHAEPMDCHVAQRTTELAIPTDQIGSSVPAHGIRIAGLELPRRVG